jgi:tetratricopeptide (TPR) repeat protein
MRLFLQLLVFSILLCHACSHIPAIAAENYFEQAQHYYGAGEIATAKQYLQKELAVHPKNAIAHYYLANSLLKSGQNNEAIKEYQSCISIDPQCPSAQYSRLALNSLLGKSASPGQERSPNPVRDSAQKVSNQTNEREQEALSECNARIKDVRSEAERKISQLENEKLQRIEDNGQPVVLRRVLYGGRLGAPFTTYDPAEANEQIRQDYDAQISRIRQDADKRIEEITLQYKKKAAALEDSAITLDKSYLGSHAEAKVNLVPAGTNMYTRNYQTSDDASGQPVPMLAAPPKSLPRHAVH